MQQLATRAAGACQSAIAMLEAASVACDSWRWGRLPGDCVLKCFIIEEGVWCAEAQERRWHQWRVPLLEPCTTWHPRSGASARSSHHRSQEQAEWLGAALQRVIACERAQCSGSYDGCCGALQRQALRKARGPRLARRRVLRSCARRLTAQGREGREAGRQVWAGRDEVHVQARLHSTRDASYAVQHRGHAGAPFTFCWDRQGTDHVTKLR
jgi:hypothetical protein